MFITALIFTQDIVMINSTIVTVPKTGGPQKQAKILKNHSSVNFQLINSIFAPNEAHLSKLYSHFLFFIYDENSRYSN